MSTFQRADRFLGFDAAYEQAQWVLWGLPMDYTASFQPGSRFGPPRIREASWGLETYSPVQDADLGDYALADLGDLELPMGNVEKSLNLIEQAAADILADGKRWIALGGEHLITLPLVRAACRRWPNLVVVHWDAHADLRADYLGERLSHASVIRRVTEVIPEGHLYQFGIRSGTREEMAFARAHAHTYCGDVLGPLKRVRTALEGRPVYFTLDVDVIDPAFMPGTGTPEPGGITPREALEALLELRGLRVVGADIVETMPAHDGSLRSALLSAKMVRELALIVAREDADE